MGYLYVLLVILAVVWIDYNRRKTVKEEFMKKIRNQWGKPLDKICSREELERIAWRFTQSDSTDFLDDITWQDLDMDTLFCRMNNTGSSAGQEYLYELLRTPVMDWKELQKRDAFMEAVAADDCGREKLQFALFGIGKCKRASLARYLELLWEVTAQSNTRHYAILFAFVLALAVMMLADAGTGMLLLFAVLGYSIVDYYRCKAKIEPYVICIKCVAQMASCCQTIAGLNRPYVENDKMAEYGKLFLRETKKLKLISSGTDYNGSLMDTLMDYVRMITHVDLIMFNQIVSSFQQKRDSIEALVSAVGHVDAMIAAASWRCSLAVWTKPVFDCENRTFLAAEQIYHPLLENPVKNSISVNGCVLLTGSNASGKSTFLRTLAVNAVLAQTIDTCTAASYQSGMVSIYSSMSLQDDLLKGDSYFMVEIKAIKRILAACESGHRVLCFVDEVLRGTNTVERIAASTSILRYLKQKGALCFAATHDIELTRLLEADYRNYHFEETVTEEDISFRYCLLEGPAMTRNAIRLLKLMEYEPAIIEESERMAAEFLESGNWILEKKEALAGR